MPSTSDQTYNTIKGWFPGVDGPDWPVLQVLRSQGFCEHKGMIYPEVPSRSITNEQWTLISYLIEEWDYGYDPTFVVAYNA